MLLFTFLLLLLTTPVALPAATVAPAAPDDRPISVAWPWKLGATAPADTSFVRQAHRRLTFQFDKRYSLVSSQFVGINGLKVGIEWRGRYRAGGGLYLLSPGVPAARPTDLPREATSEIRLRYFALWGEYVLYGNPRWELSIPVQLGYGKYYHQYRVPGEPQRRTPMDRIWLLEPTIAAHYRVFRWIGVGVGVGWREAFDVKREYRNELAGPIFYVRGKLFLGDLLKVARGRQRLFTQRGLRRADWAPHHLGDDAAADDGGGQ